MIPLNNETLGKARVTKEELEAIKADFLVKRGDYQTAARHVLDALINVKGVHSVRYRVKDVDHLADKIIRKHIENPNRVINLENYEEEITDLAGVRVIHLFKNELPTIYAFIQNGWEVIETPKAFFRKGDPGELIAELKEIGCETQERDSGYRSVHFLVPEPVVTNAGKKKHIVEIQVRTIFEEGWGEIDHRFRYPSISNNPLTNQLLLILNRLAGTVDEMSSLVQTLYSELNKPDSTTNNSESKKLPASQSQPEQEVRQITDIIQNFRPNPEKEVFAPFANLLKQQVSQTAISFNTTISSIEEIIGQKLPDNAYRDVTWWTAYSSHARQWLLAGWSVKNVNFTTGEIAFYRWSQYIDLSDKAAAETWASRLGISSDKLKGLSDFTGPLSAVIMDYIESNDL